MFDFTSQMFKGACSDPQPHTPIFFKIYIETLAQKLTIFESLYVKWHAQKTKKKQKKHLLEIRKCGFHIFIKQ